jgi:hypothetical protein
MAHDAVVAQCATDLLVVYEQLELRTGLGFFCMLEDQSAVLFVPFTTSLLSQEVVVVKIDITEEDEIVVICKRGQSRRGISLTIPYSSPASIWRGEKIP